MVGADGLGGKVVIVTGGVSGIGEAMAWLFTESGATVMIARRARGIRGGLHRPALHVRAVRRDGRGLGGDDGGGGGGGARPAGRHAQQHRRAAPHGLRHRHGHVGAGPRHGRQRAPS